ncbi:MULTISPECIES: NAD-dependent epimerase/dehydratase family protein [unclassified Pseudomonas]|uniref:NAD-dependent epimerase/dehydratase family protein n=1 Tax=unclassified Pseudomonas TaxID=196821 RepID=UPI000D36D147|nr:MULTISPECIES: NAD-dependent epimerase/dehydratase family protein [unclassified Pseudomonas]RAU48619.1 SDR family NAD(P)-dependent oxidoreductase [Pseudomonas sp. RIT 409]RAU54121.1 SDR family NAD(P)-dependent oxidoreductase [Pseudomonas sp. RIT 412]
MAGPSVLIAGCGDIGSRLATQVLASGWTVYGLRRNTAKLPRGVQGVTADLFDARMPDQWPDGRIDYLVYCATPSERNEAGYRAAYVQGLHHVLGWIQRSGQKPRRVVFVSSSSVYGQQGGEWVDEASPAEADGFSGRIMREAEQVALASGWPASVVRLTGIYGPGRSDLMNRVRQGYSVAVDPPLYGNRIHADDAAGLLAFLLQADARGVALDDCYLGVDDAPAPLAEVVDWMRQRLGVTRWSDENSVRRAGSKRCSNARAKALGWAPRYASYKEGYEAMLAADPI